MLAERAEKDKKIGELSNPFALTITLLEQAETRAIDASKRADLLKDPHEEKLRELTDLQVRHILLEAALGKHADRLLSPSSQLEQKDADLSNAQGQVEELSVSKERHARRPGSPSSPLQHVQRRPIRSTRNHEIGLHSSRAIWLR